MTVPIPTSSTATEVSEADVARFEALQKRLLPMWRSLEEGEAPPHTSVVVPSLSFDQEELMKIQGVSFYEERLLFSLIRLRDPRASVIYLTSQPVHPEIVDYYLGLLRGVTVRSARARLHLICLYDASPQALTRKILDRPRLVGRLRDLLHNPRHSYLTCFNSTELERRLALELGIPLNGADPALLWAGSKSGSRKIFDEAGVDQAPGFADLTGEEDLLEALAELKERNPDLSRAVVKLNESFAGAGNALFTYPSGGSTDKGDLRGALQEMKWTTPNETFDSYLSKFTLMGGIAEEFIEASDLRSPSVQARINPDGSVTLLSTHDQVLGGPTQQTYLGCRFPADSDYRTLIQAPAVAVAEALRSHGVVSRFGVDFLVFRRDDAWRALAVEINLRMGGTTPPFQALAFLTGGRLDEESGLFRAGERTKFYYATDNLRADSYRGLLPEDLMEVLAAEGIDFDPATQTGAVFHMIGALSQFGKVGVTCIGDTAQQAEAIYDSVVRVLDRAGGDVPSADSRPLHPFEVTVRGME